MSTLRCIVMVVLLDFLLAIDLGFARDSDPFETRKLTPVAVADVHQLRETDFTPTSRIYYVDELLALVIPRSMRALQVRAEEAEQNPPESPTGKLGIQLADAYACFARNRLVNEGGGTICYPGEEIRRPLYSNGHLVFSQGDSSLFSCDVTVLRPSTDARKLLMRTFYFENVDTSSYKRFISTTIQSYGEPFGSCFITILSGPALPTKWMVITTRYLDENGSTAHDQPSPNVICALGLSDEMIYPSTPHYKDALSIMVFCQTKVWDYVDSHTYKGCSEGISIGVYQADQLNNLHAIRPGIVVEGILSPDGVAVGGSNLASRFVLEENYPNPFNPTTRIRYQVSGVSDVKITVYDLLGREVAVLVNERKAPGSYEVPFNAEGLSSGVYVYRMTTESFAECRKMLLLR